LSYTGLTHPDDMAAILENLQAIREGRVREFTVEKRCRRKDGSTVWVSLTVSPLREDGKPHATYIAIVQDITQRKLAETAIQAQLEELHRWNQVTLGRETRVLELKQEVNALLARAGEAPRYDAIAADKVPS
jgi:hypothetical protein